MSAPVVRHLSSLDGLLSRADSVLRALAGPGSQQQRSYPAADLSDPGLDAVARKHAIGLMRVNHAGEVCAQALYVGQGVFSRNSETYEFLQQAAREEGDHLLWCEQRLDELGGRTSALNPLWFGGSMAIGLVASLAGDRLSLAFVEETEHQVVAHLDSHLAALPQDDLRSRAVVAAMRDDESRHAQHAGRSGSGLPLWVRALMRVQARIMTTAAYRY